MIKLTQNESNLLLWTKGHYEGRSHETFWPQINALYMEVYGMDEPYVDGIYHMVRELWKKILNVLPNKETLLDKYEDETVPSKACFYWGAKNFGIWYNPETDRFDDEEILRARICVMCSQIKLTKVKYYEYLPAEETAGLKLNKKD